MQVWWHMHGLKVYFSVLVSVSTPPLRGCKLIALAKLCTSVQCVRTYLTQAPPPETKVNLHFVSIVQKEGHLYELGEERTCSTSRLVRAHSVSVWGWVCRCMYVTQYCSQ